MLWEQIVYFGCNTTLILPVVIESFPQPPHMLTWCSSIREGGMIHYQLVPLQLAPPLDNSCLVPQLEPITRAGRQPACQMWGLLRTLKSKQKRTHACTYTDWTQSLITNDYQFTCDVWFCTLSPSGKHQGTWDAAEDISFRRLYFPSKPKSDLVVATDSPCGKQSPLGPCY